MADKASGKGGAHDAMVITEDDVESITDEESKAQAIAEADAAVASAEAKVQRQEEHLAGAKISLENARAARKEL